MELEESEVLSESLISFLEKTELGTNGARYAHLDVRERIKKLDFPQSFTLKRNEIIVANVTFCIRDFSMYVRYFAFNAIYQSTSNTKRKRSSKSIFEIKILELFQKLERQRNLPFYAYIEADNSRSMLMSKRFGFKPYTHIISRSFSRLAPKLNKNVSFSSNWSEISDHVREQYHQYDSYFEAPVSQPPFVVLRDNEGAILAYARFTKVAWRIHRLPGILGGVLVKIVPYIPLLNRLIKPKKHIFLTPDIVSGISNAAQLQDLFSGALALYDVKSMIWFIDPNDPVYKSVKQGFSWGVLDRIIGIKKINIMQRNAIRPYSEKHPFFVSAFDLI
jgi:hypothetical protein